MTDLSKVHELLVELTAKATFTPEALKQFQIALDKVKAMEASLVDAFKERDAYRRTADGYLEKLNDHKMREQSINRREDAVAKREAAMTELEKKLAVAEAKESVRKEVFDTLFRNVTVRRKATDSVSESLSGPSGYSSSTKTHNIDEESGEE
jgi:hypothetical protein